MGATAVPIGRAFLKTFSPEIIEDLQQENKLTTEYSKLIASAKIQFEGEERTLSQLIPFQQSTDRNMRKRAMEASSGFMAENEANFDRIYDDLVKVRTKIAKKLGFNNYVELGYARMARTDYNAEMVANFRNQVLEHIVPVASKLKERRQKRIDVDQLLYYDENFSFKSGNATPKGDPDWIVNHGAKMYEELSPETHEFFTFMQENGLMDLVAKKASRAADTVPISASMAHRLFSPTLTGLPVILMCSRTKPVMRSKYMRAEVSKYRSMGSQPMRRAKSIP